LRELLKGKAPVRIDYWGRKEDSVPAVGVSGVYKEQQERVVKGAFNFE
jgi:hypothetical protein